MTARKRYDQQMEKLIEQLLIPPNVDKGGPKSHYDRKEDIEDLKNRIKDSFEKGMVFIHLNIKKSNEDDIQSFGFNTNFPTTTWHIVRNAIIYTGADPCTYKISSIHLFDYITGEFQPHLTLPKDVPLQRSQIEISLNNKKPMKFLAIVEKVGQGQQNIMDEITKYEEENSNEFFDTNLPLCPKSHISCGKMLKCDHPCGGIKNEEECLPCIICEQPSNQRNADDPCTICWDRIGSSPFIQIRCGHLFHFNCLREMIEKGWSGISINFGFMNCPECKKEISHPSLEAILTSKKILKAEIAKKALERLNADRLIEAPEITTSTSQFYNDPQGFALHHYAFVQCNKCTKAYYFGAADCLMQLDPENAKPEMFLCSACSHTVGIESCKIHGKDYLDYKCRYCCSVALFFCFGTHHFCEACHSNGAMKFKKFPQCPVGRGCVQLENGPCPLGLREPHAPTGEEFSLGCYLCRSIKNL